MTNVWWFGSKYMQATGGTRLLLGLELPSTQLELDLRQGLDEISEIPVILMTIANYVNF